MNDLIIQKRFPVMLMAWLLIFTLQNCLGNVNGASREKKDMPHFQTPTELTPLDLTRITFNEDISFLSASEQELFRKWKSKFFESLKRLPEKDQNELKEAYKWVPDVVKIIASRDGKDRRNDAYKIYPGSKLYSTIKQALSQKLHPKQKSGISNPISVDYILDICSQISYAQYPSKLLYTKSNVQGSNGITTLDLTRITFNEDISFLSTAEQELFRKWKAEFFESLKLLPAKDQRELKEAYKWTPDIVKIIASRNDQDRKISAYKIYPGSQLSGYIEQTLFQKLYPRQKSEISAPRGMHYVVDICSEMVDYQYPLKMVYAKKQKSMTAARIPLTRLNLSRITFGDNISFLSAPEQERYKRCQAEFFESLKRLPEKKQSELKEAYELVPDVVKIIASRSYQSRKGYEIRSGTMFYANIKNALNRKLRSKQRFGGSNSEEVDYVIDLCRQMIRYRYPLDTFDIENQDIDENAKKAGFGYLARMIDFWNDPANLGKQYNRCIDNPTLDRTMDEISVFGQIGSRYEDVIWKDFKLLLWTAIRKFWKFDLKKVDTSNLTATEYEKMRQQLKYVPPEILIVSRCTDYDTRMVVKPKCREILKDPSYIKKYALKKGISLSETEVQEVHKLASEILIYGTPLKLVKRDDTADLKKVAKDYGFTRVGGFCFYYNRKKKKNSNIKFYSHFPERIPGFVVQAKDFYALGMAINPEGTKALYNDIATDTGIIFTPVETKNSPNNMEVIVHNPRFAPYIRNGLQDLNQHTRAQ